MLIGTSVPTVIFWLLVVILGKKRRLWNSIFFLKKVFVITPEDVSRTVLTHFYMSTLHVYAFLASFLFFLHSKIPMYHKNRVCSLKAELIHIVSVPHHKIKCQSSSLRRLVVTFVEIIIVQASTSPF